MLLYRKAIDIQQTVLRFDCFYKSSLHSITRNIFIQNQLVVALNDRKLLEG